MAVRKRGRRKWRAPHTHGPGDWHPNGDENAAARLAPLEETDAFEKSEQITGSHSAVNDTIRVDRSSVKMPENFTADERDAAGTFRLDPAVLVIVALMLAFVAFIAWQITLMPEK